MRSLAELMQPGFPTGYVGPEPHHDLAVVNELAEWGDAPYVELSVTLVHLRFLYFLHQTHHWVASGDSFYGDHKLFEQLYTEITEEIDDVAEKAVGLGGEQNVNLGLQVIQIDKLVKSCGDAQTVPNSSELARKSLRAEIEFVKLVHTMLTMMKEEGADSDGVQNMLQGIADKHERHVYLLKRRCSVAALGM